MISYEPLWATMKARNITKYQLIFYWGISSNTLRRMSHDEPISTATLNEFCLILNCQPQDIISFKPTKEELETIDNQVEEINNRKRKHKKNKP